MADSSLDDFFAKKDKSKKKSKSSKLTPDDILSKTDELVKKEKKSKKDKSKSQTSKTTEDNIVTGVIDPAEVPAVYCITWHFEKKAICISCIWRLITQVVTFTMGYKSHCRAMPPSLDCRAWYFNFLFFPKQCQIFLQYNSIL